MQTTKKPLLKGQRLCTCPPKQLNCLNAKEWLKAQMGVWQVYYEGRDVRDKEIHPAVMPLALAKKIVELFTHKGELVLDPFNGIGTTLLACQDLERNALGFDINKKYCLFTEKRLAQQKPEAHRTEQIVMNDDARNVSNYIEPESLTLVVTSPPYANLLNRPRLNKSRRGKDRKNDQFLKIEQYSQDSRDLGTLAVEAYAKELGEIYGKLIPLLRPNGHSVINVPDMWWSNGDGGKRIPIHIYVYHAMVDAGYELRNTIIWDRMNLVNRVGIFGWPSNYITMGTTFEYLLDFWKPAN